MRRLPFIIMAIVGLTLTVACRTTDKESDTVPDNALKIGYLPSADALPYMVAEQMGVYDSLELDVRFVPMSGPVERDTTFIHHGTDGLLLSLAESCRLQQDSVDIVPAAATVNNAYLMVPYDSNFVSLKYLYGKTVGLHLYSSDQQFMDHVLERGQMTAEDVNLINIGDARTRLQMLLNGQLDAAVLPDPQATYARADSCILLAVSAVYGTEHDVLAFSDSTLLQREDEIRRLIIGYNRAVDYMNQQPASQWLRTASTRMGLPADSLNKKRAPFAHMTSITPQMKADTQEWINSKELLPRKQGNFRTANIELEN